MKTKSLPTPIDQITNKFPPEVVQELVSDNGVCMFTEEDVNMAKDEPCRMLRRIFVHFGISEEHFREKHFHYAVNILGHHPTDMKKITTDFNNHKKFLRRDTMTAKIFSRIVYQILEFKLVNTTYHLVNPSGNLVAINLKD